MIFRSSRNIVKAGVHLLIWAVLFLFPYFVFPPSNDDFHKVFALSWFPLIEYALLFYFNYFILDKYLFTKKYFLFILFNLVTIAVLIGVRFWFNAVFGVFRIPNIAQYPPKGFPSGPPHGGHHGYGFPDIFLFSHFLSFLIPVIFAVSIRAIENWIKLEGEKREMENKNLQSELQNLRYQLHPHFFFNSLNNIYSLIEISPKKAQQTVHSLSQLMRYLLYETSREKVLLESEVHFLVKYIELMKLRHSARHSIEYDFRYEQDGSYLIAPLLFMPLIENAFKHGISSIQDSSVFFSLKMENENLYFKTRNTNFPKEDDANRSGIGLENIQKRLQLIYPGKYKLSYGVQDGHYIVDLMLELK